MRVISALRPGGPPTGPPVAVGGLDHGAHLRERPGDPLHRAPPERVVAGQLEATGLAGEDPGQQADRRAGVAAVDRLAGIPEAAEADALATRPDLELAHDGRVTGEPEPEEAEPESGRAHGDSSETHADEDAESDSATADVR